MKRWVSFASAFFILQGIEAFNFVDRTLFGEWEGKGGDKLSLTLNLLLMVCSLMLFGKGLPNLRTIRTGAILAASLVAFLFCSAGWSIDPQSSIRNAILYGFAVLGAVGIVANLRADEFMQQLALLCFLGAVASLLVFAVSPASAYGEAGDFRGIFSQKNVLGEAMTMGALASLHGLRATKTSRARNAIFLLVVSIVAVKSQSATSCLTIFSFCATDALLWLFRKGGAARIVAIAAIIVALPVMMFVAISPDSVLEIIGKDPTLTGRTEIWHFVVADIYQKPWLGWGYLAFWSPNNPAAMEIANALRWFAPQAHNGVLEMLLCVGLIGTAYFVFLWGRTVFLSLQCLSTNQNAIAISCLLSCGGIILVGISETVLIDPFEASTSVFFITGLFCEKAVRAARLRRSSTARVDVARRVPLRT